MKQSLYAVAVTVFVLVAANAALAQVPQKTPAPDQATTTVKQSLSLAQRGRCKESLQLFRQNASHLADKEFKLKSGVAILHCAMSRGQSDTALETIQLLNREFPHDPEVLYLTTHAYSDLSTNAAMELARIAPDSYQAREMNAEALEIQGKWQDAAAEYRKILEQNPELPGIHFRIGRLILSQPETPTMQEDAKKEFVAELRIDPNNAGAEYILGEFARQQSQWAEAIQHFSTAVKLDPGLTDALLGLGSAYLADGKAQEAVAPLEAYVKLQPGNPAGHYQLAMTYNRVGRRDDAKREAERQRETAEKIEQEKQKNAPPPTSSEQPTGPPQ